MNHFEYRYLWADDFIDDDEEYAGGLIKYSQLTQDDLNKIVADINDTTGWNLDTPTAIGTIGESGATEEQK
jgi:hypothetical protein